MSIRPASSLRIIPVAILGNLMDNAVLPRSSPRKYILLSTCHRTLQRDRFTNSCAARAARRPAAHDRADKLSHGFWHEERRKDDPQHQGDYHKNMRFAASFFILRFCFVAEVRSGQIASSKIAASGARALLAMTNLMGFAGKRNGFQNEKFQILAE